MKLSIYAMLFALFIQLFPQNIVAESLEETDNEQQEVFLFAETADETIDLYEDLGEKNVLVTIPDDTKVELIETLEDDFTLVKYIEISNEKDSETQEIIWTGYVLSDYVINSEEAEKIREDRHEAELNKDYSEETQSAGNETVEEKTSKEKVVDLQKNQQSNVDDQQNQQVQEEVGKVPDEEQESSSSPQLPKESPVIKGVAIKQPTPIYADTNVNSSVLKTYKQGHILSFRALDANWYIANVYVNDEKLTGYINKDDVDLLIDSKRIEGYAVKQIVSVYATPSQSAKSIKSYKIGQALVYRSFSSEWHEATVYVNGKKQQGYIHAKDVSKTAPSLSGVSINLTTVYSNASTSSKKLKTYKQGRILKYKSYTSSWHVVTVIINGKKQTGYIKTSDVGDLNATLKGYALIDQTNIYSKTSKSSSKLKTYKKGHLLQYKYYNSNWFKATVYINGKAKTGYINAKDVSINPPLLKGYAIANPTIVYSKTSKSSAKVKSYKLGSALQYRPYDKNWYIVTVYVNGKKQTGYIHVKDVGDKKASKPTGNTNIVNPLKVYSYSNMINDIKKLQKAYPDLITYKVIGKSEYGRNIYAVSIGNGKPTTFINGAHHAREWITTNLNMYMLEQYAKAYYKKQKIQGYNVKSILNSTTIWFVPMVNPDGVTLQQQGLKAFPKSDHASLIKMNEGSKDFKRWKANAKGIDLNRQYDAGWKTIHSSPKAPSYKNFKGYSPASAAEVKAILKFDKEIDPEIAVAYHSSGKLLYWNYKQDAARYKRDHVYANVIGKMTGYALMYPGPNPSGGGYTDWFIQARKRPGFTPEIATYVYESSPPLSEFNGAWRENQAVGLYVAQESVKLYAARKK
ncbi:M14 family metallocarboxypeptidase [Bacillus sp. FJAT-49711]|nr:M14 family metallocarboxypeptidase [Bacillus sp. FJAT-49711]